VYGLGGRSSLPLPPFSPLPLSFSSLPSPPLFSPSRTISLPFPSPLSPSPWKKAPLLRLGGQGERFRSPSWSGRSPAAKRYLVNFRLKISRLVATIFSCFSGNETPNWGGVGCPVIKYFCADKLFGVGHHNGIEDVLQGCGNGSSPPLPSR